VRDNGPGVPLDEREKVLRRLYRLERSRTSEGNGLGLSLVSAICALHGATLLLDDAGPGLIVRITFPVMGRSRFAETQSRTT
jgi:signal transduction histidine kinase